MCPDEGGKRDLTTRIPGASQDLVLEEIRKDCIIGLTVNLEIQTLNEQKYLINATFTEDDTYADRVKGQPYSQQIHTMSQG